MESVNTMRLYDLGQKYLDIGDRLLDSLGEDGVVDPEIAAEFAAIEDQLATKFAACCRIVRNLESLSDACFSEAQRLKKKAEAAERRISGLKEFIKFNLESISEKKLVCDELFTVAIQQSPPSTVIENLELVPHEFDKVLERQVSITMVRDALKAGIDVPGAKLVQNTHLRIR